MLMLYFLFLSCIFLVLLHSFPLLPFISFVFFPSLSLPFPFSLFYYYFFPPFFFPHTDSILYLNSLLSFVVQIYLFHIFPPLGRVCVRDYAPEGQIMCNNQKVQEEMKSEYKYIQEQRVANAVTRYFLLFCQYVLRSILDGHFVLTWPNS